MRSERPGDGTVPPGSATVCLERVQQAELRTLRFRLAKGRALRYRTRVLSQYGQALSVMVAITSKRKAGGRPWWEARRCELCRAKIGKLRAWEEPPRLVAGDGRAIPGRTVSRSELSSLLLTHRLFCPDCWSNRWGETLALARQPRPASDATG